MNLPLLNSNQLMMGVDSHIVIPIPLLLPYPQPPVPNHMVCAPITGVPPNPMAEGFSQTVMNDFFKSVHRGHDIGMWIPHLAPNALIPLIMLGSGSVCEWGGFTVKLDNQPSALAFPFFIGALNLNCAEPVAGTSLNINTAAGITVLVGFKLGDFFGSVFAIVFDIAIGKILELLGKGALKVIGKVANKAISALLKDGSLLKAALTTLDVPGPVTKLFREMVDELKKKSVKTGKFGIKWSNYGAMDADDRFLGGVINAGGAIKDAFIGQVILGGGPGEDAPIAVANAFDLNGKFRDPGAQGIADYFNGVESAN